MSENKRANLITVDSGKSKKLKVQKTIRISLDLFESNEKECPEFNYKELVKAEENKRRAEKEKKVAAAPNGLRDPFSDDNEEDVERIAKQFEQKYGGSSTYGRSKGRCKQDDYADIGAGYDENDSFIDNTDGYDEIIPPECDTAFGGFYINSGSLEFKNVSGAGLPSNAVVSEGNEDSVPGIRKSQKRALSSSESEDESSSSDEDSEASTGEKATESDAKPSKSNGVTDSDKSGEDGKKPKPAKVKEDGKNALPRKKRKSVDSNPGVVAESKPAKEAPPDTPTIPEENNDGSTDSRSSDSSSTKQAVPVPSSDNMASSDSSREAPPPPLPVCAPPAPPPPPACVLPPGLPPEAATLARRLKALADTHFASHTGKLAGPEVNEIILGMEKQCRRGGMPSNLRQTLFSHAAELLRRGKPGLMQRARRLADEHERSSNLRLPLDKLKEIIAEMKPALLETYRIESQKIFEINKQISSQNAVLEDDRKIPEKRLPKRRFPWNDQVRGILFELSKCVVDGGRHESEEVAAKYLQQVVLPLFPVGFVRMPTLLQQARFNKLMKIPNEAALKKLSNKVLESKQAANCLPPSSTAKSSHKVPSATTTDNRNSQPIERNISDPESVAIVAPRPKAQTSSICIGTDVEHFKVNQENSQPQKMLGNNVSISVTSVFHKKDDSPPKNDKYISPNSLTITALPSSPKDMSKNFQHPSNMTSKHSSNSSSNNANSGRTENPGQTNNTSQNSMMSPGATKPKTNLDKSTIAKIISSKNSSPDHNKQPSTIKDRMKTQPEPPPKLVEKNYKAIILDGSNKSRNSDSPGVSSSKNSSNYRDNVEDLKSPYRSSSDMFVKPKYKTDNNVHSRHSSSYSSPSNANVKYSSDSKSDSHRTHKEHSKSSDRSVDVIKTPVSQAMPPVIRGPERAPMSTSTPQHSSHTSSLKHHRIIKKPEKETMVSGSSGMMDPHRNNSSSSSYKSSSSNTPPKADTLKSPNQEDSSSDDCVEVFSDSWLNKSIEESLKKDLIQQQIMKQYNYLYPDSPSVKNNKSDFLIKNIVSDNPSHLVKDILKSPDDPQENNYIENNRKASSEKDRRDKIVIKPCDGVQVIEDYEDVKKASSQPEVVRSEHVSVIKDNYTVKPDRFKETVPEGKGSVAVKEEEPMDHAIDKVMQGLKELQDLQQGRSDRNHQRHYEESSKNIYQSPQYSAENKTIIFNNQNMTGINDNLMSPPPQAFIETSAAHNLTTGSLQ